MDTCGQVDPPPTRWLSPVSHHLVAPQVSRLVSFPAQPHSSIQEFTVPDILGVVAFKHVTR